MTKKISEKEKMLQSMIAVADKKCDTIIDWSETKNPQRVEKDKFLTSIASLGK